MAPQTWRDSAAYITYAAFETRPANLPLWSRTPEGKYIIETGEHFCRFGVSGRPCDNDKRFASKQEVLRHVKSKHDSTMIADARGRTKANATLIALYTDLLAAAGVAPLLLDPVAALKPEGGDERRVAANHANDIPEADVEDDEDLDDAMAYAPNNMNRPAAQGQMSISFSHLRPARPVPPAAAANPSRLPQSIIDARAKEELENNVEFQKMKELSRKRDTTLGLEDGKTSLATGIKAMAKKTTL